MSEILTEHEEQLNQIKDTHNSENSHSAEDVLPSENSEKEKILMDEKKIISGEFYNPTPILIGGGIFALLTLIYSLWWWGHLEHTNHEIINGIRYGYFDPFFFIGIPVFIIFIGVYFWIGRCEISVTNKRIYGKSVMGQQVDLPMDSISAVGTVAIFHGISVSTSSGRIKFMLVKNSTDVFNSISNCLRERQNK